MPHSTHDETRTMSRPSSTSTGPANAFPKPAGATLLAPEPAGDQMSPSRSTFSFDDSSPKSVQGSDKAGDVVVRPASRDAAAAAADKKPPAPVVHSVIPQQRKQYYDDKFAYKDDATSSARDRVTKDAPIVAELRTNVIVKDEYTLVTDLSHHLSIRYQRPESSIMITVNHSACLLLGGSFEPTYVLTISALPVQIMPTLNKRNAALIQSFLSESIGVSAERGILKFVPIPEESLAINGMTVLGEIERLEKQYADENGISLKRGLTKSSRRSAVSKSKSSSQLSRSNSKAANGGARAVVTPPIPSPRPFDSGVAVDENGADQLTPLQPVENFHARKSSMGRTPSKRIFGDKSESKANAGGLHGKSVTMTIPDDVPKAKIGKRKSFMTVFRR